MSIRYYNVGWRNDVIIISCANRKVTTYPGDHKCDSYPRVSHLIQVTATHLPLDKIAAILADDIFKCIFLNENVWISIKISLKFVP